MLVLHILFFSLHVYSIDNAYTLSKQDRHGYTWTKKNSNNLAHNNRFPIPNLPLSKVGTLAYSIKHMEGEGGSELFSPFFYHSPLPPPLILVLLLPLNNRMSGQIVYMVTPSRLYHLHSICQVQRFLQRFVVYDQFLVYLGVVLLWNFLKEGSPTGNFFWCHPISLCLPQTPPLIKNYFCMVKRTFRPISKLLTLLHGVIS